MEAAFQWHHCILVSVLLASDGKNAIVTLLKNIFLIHDILRSVTYNRITNLNAGPLRKGKTDIEQLS